VFQDFGGPTPELTIINPPTEPKDGEIVGFRLRDFRMMKILLKELKPMKNASGTSYCLVY